MSKLSFSKYHGAGNDFILIDDRAALFNPQVVPELCNRKFGIGADGVILLQNDSCADFRMRIYNADGSEAESCGNGLRCLMKFLLELGFPRKTVRIATGQRIVEASYQGEKVAVNMGAATNLKRQFIDGYEVYSLNTGVPHAVIFGDGDLRVLGPAIQLHPVFSPLGTNVNLAQVYGNCIHLRTFERGVGETLACGTGAVAVGYLASLIYSLPSPIPILMPGGQVEIAVAKDCVTLIGTAVKVFKGFA